MNFTKKCVAQRYNQRRLIAKSLTTGACLQNVRITVQDACTERDYVTFNQLTSLSEARCRVAALGEHLG
jgi:hypothetical protein